MEYLFAEQLETLLNVSYHFTLLRTITSYSSFIINDASLPHALVVRSFKRENSLVMTIYKYSIL